MRTSSSSSVCTVNRLWGGSLCTSLALSLDLYLWLDCGPGFISSFPSYLVLCVRELVCFVIAAQHIREHSRWKRKVKEDSREKLISLLYFYILFVSLILRGISWVLTGTHIQSEYLDRSRTRKRERNLIQIDTIFEKNEAFVRNGWRISYCWLGSAKEESHQRNEFLY